MTLAAAAEINVPPEATSAGVRARLGGMMFLQYFMQGAYAPIASVYVQDHLKFDSRQLGFFNASLAVGPLLAPFIIGQLADRHIATERLLAACHFLAGCLMLALYLQAGFWPVVALGTIYSVLWVPTMMLTNSLALAHLRQRDREFPRVRLWGTIGFIVPAWMIEFWWLSGLKGDDLNGARGVAFALSGIAGLVMAAYCLTLPHTPPEGRPNDRFAPAEAIGMLRERSVLVLVGATAYLARCLLLALAGTELPFATSLALAIAGQMLHGFCFGCFLAVAFIFVDRVAPPDARRSMQTLYGTLVFGLGIFVGAWVAGLVGQMFEFESGSSVGHTWTPLWLTCASLAAIALVAFGMLFPDIRTQDRPAVADPSQRN